MTVIRSRRRSSRSWRRRGRRGQVAAVATILGLLLVVTFIANYLTTTLPNQMSINDLDHELQVENQLGRFQALLEQVANVGAVGAPLTQPVTLGSSGLPPFADADMGSIGPLNGSNYSLSYTLAGPTSYSPPNAGTPGGYAGTCALTSTSAVVQLACTGLAHVTYNFTGTPSEGFVFDLDAGGTFALNVTTSGTTAAPEPIDVAMSDASPLDLYVLGSNDSISLGISTGSTVNLIELGTNDSVTISEAAASTVHLYAVGYHDTVTISDGVGLVLTAYLFGWDDSVTMSSSSSASTTATQVTVYFVGFLTSATACPSDNLAATDSVAGSNSKGSYHAYYNVTATFTPTAVTDWTQTVSKQSPAQASCPFLATATYAPTTYHSAGIDVHLYNTYAPAADVAFDAGAILYAQPGGTPLVLDDPGLTVVETSTSVVTSVSLWLPFFIGKGAAESGIGTADLSARLVALTSIVLTPSSSYTV
ncbi:MAG TPA: hypothetical protein VMG14_08535, partial [Thermoplasmata archaeon]|nr:hypothetical protein [Thermoplasmata archaeon]